MNFPSWLKVYGDQSFRGDCPKEDACLSTFFNCIRRDYPESYGLIATHVKNEGKRSHFQAKVDRMHGMQKGACDIIIPARQAFVLELKRHDHTQSKFQSGQLDYMKAAHDAGAFVCVALGHEAALKAFDEWLHNLTFNF